MPDASRPLRVGLICTDDPRDRRCLSGTPYAVRSALLDAGAEVFDLIGPEATGGRVGGPSCDQRAAESQWAGRVVRKLGHLARKTPPGAAVARAAMLRRSRTRSTAFQRDVRQVTEREGLNVLLGCFASGLLYRFDIGRPIIHFSDLTFRLLEQTYDWAAQMPRWRRQATHAVEHDVLCRADAVIVPTEWARVSVIDDYDAENERVHVIPLGANLNESASTATHERSLPSRDDLRLTITAANPWRKRVDFAVAATARLRERGWNARLWCVGAATPDAVAAPYVHVVGRLNHDDPAQRRRHEAIMRDSHVMLLPSEAEAFGIAPVEAAHQGRPAVVSAAGGLGEVVLDGRTGRVLPVDATAEQYADAIEQMVSDDRRYQQMCEAARWRAQNVLNWDRFARDTLDLMRDLTRARARRPTPPQPPGRDSAAVRSSPGGSPPSSPARRA